MNELKIGDKVKIIETEWKGEIGKITEVKGSHPIIYRVQFGEDIGVIPFVRSELQKAR